MPESSDSLSELAYRRLVEAIDHLDLRPGESVAADRLAKQLGISRTPARDALVRLAAEGLIRQVAGRGLVVAELTLKEVQEICTLLELVDPKFTEHAAQRISREQAGALRRASNALSAAAKAGDVEAWRQVDTKWHHIMAGAAASEYFARVIADARRRLHRVSFGTLKSQDSLIACTQEHVEVAEAVIAQDASRAARAALVHQQNRSKRTVTLVTDVLIPLLGQRF